MYCQPYWTLLLSSSFIFFKSFCKISIVFGISFSAQGRQTCCKDNGYVKYFVFSGISFLHDTHFFILYGSVFLIINCDKKNRLIYKYDPQNMLIKNSILPPASWVGRIWSHYHFIMQRIIIILVFAKEYENFREDNAAQLGMESYFIISTDDVKKAE